jgi:hypothetical protein
LKTAFLILAALSTACQNTSREPEQKAAEPEPTPAKITQFYASPPVVAPGDKALLCYGVESAQSVRLDPDVERITPSMARCIEVHPKQTSTYRLIASGTGRGEAQAAVTVTVDPKAKKAAAAAAPGPTIIRFFSASATSTPAGGRVTLCYGVEGAKSVTLSPGARTLPSVPQSCFTEAINQTTTFTLSAVNAAGATDSEKLTVQVQ